MSGRRRRQRRRWRRRRLTQPVLLLARIMDAVLRIRSFSFRRS